MALVQRFFRRFVLLLAALGGGVLVYSLASGGDPDFESPNYRGVMHFGAAPLTVGNDCLPSGAAWLLGATKTNGSWVNGSWQVGAEEPNPAAIQPALRAC